MTVRELDRDQARHRDVEGRLAKLQRGFMALRAG
jgi:hypothetical protein